MVPLPDADNAAAADDSSETELRNKQQLSSTKNTRDSSVSKAQARLSAAA